MNNFAVKEPLFKLFTALSFKLAWALRICKYRAAALIKLWLLRKWLALDATKEGDKKQS